MSDVTLNPLECALDEAQALRGQVDALQAENASLREEFNKMDVWHSKELTAAMADNAKLREELAKARDPQRIGGQADPSSFVYAIEQLREFRWQHATNDDDAIPYINNVVAAHERENAKLRELVRNLLRVVPRDVSGVVIGAHSEHPTYYSFDDAMRELGIEVG